MTREQIDDLYSWISEELVDLETGEYTTEVNIETYDPREAAEKEATSVANRGSRRTTRATTAARKSPRSISFAAAAKGRSNRSSCRSTAKGLWSTLYGYLALKSDLETIQGLTFYEHGETPGLGGEVDNPSWKASGRAASFTTKTATRRHEVFKGPAPDDNPYAVDGLSGATITSRGVTNLVRYWASDEGYGPFLDKLKTATQR